MKNKWSVIILTAVFALAFCVTACGRNDDDTSNVSDDKGTINEALELYQSTARKVKALNSVSYKAASDTRLKFNKDESQKASSRISVKEIYTDDSLQLFLSESSNNYGTPSRQTIYYKDGTAYYRVNSSTGKEKIELDKFMTSSAAQSNPLVCLKQNRIFDISEDSLTECEKEQENGQDIIKLTDITLPGIDKAYGIGKLLELNGWSKDEALFFGDKLQEGGNDFPVKQMGVDSIEVRGLVKGENFLV